MIEIWASVFLFILTMLVLSTRWALPPALSMWPSWRQVSLVIALLLPLYLAGYLGFSVVIGLLGRRRLTIGDILSGDPRQGDPLWPGEMLSLSWPGHLGITVLMLLGLSILTMQPAVNTIYLALLTWGCVVLLGHFVASWRGARRPPMAPQNLNVTAGRGFVDISWELSNDPRCAEYVLVRGLATAMPATPDQGRILRRGILASFRDLEVEPGQSYLYLVFAHDGQGRYRTTMGQSCTALPLPAPPFDLAYESARTGILLRWKLSDEYTVRDVSVIRRPVDESGEAIQVWLTPDKTSWLDSGLREATRYKYQVRARDTDDQPSAPAKLLAATLAPPVAGLQAHTKDRNQVVLSWQPPEQVFGYQGVTLTRVPEDASREPLDVLKNGLEHEYQDPDLEYDTRYQYTIRAAYLPPIESEPSTARVATGPRPQGPKDIAVNPERRAISLQWSLPEHEAIRTAKLGRVESDPFSDTEQRHTLIQERAQRYTDAPLEPDTQYIYELALQADDGHWSATERIKAKTQPPPPEVTHAQAEYVPAEAKVHLTWNLPVGETDLSVRIVRKRNGPPSGPQDGVEVYAARGTDAFDTDAPIDCECYYALYTLDVQGTCSIPVFLSVSTYSVLQIWVHCPNLGTRAEVRLPAYLSISQVASVLFEHKIDFGSVTGYWSSIQETGTEIKPQQSLRDAGLASGQTILLVFETVPPEAEPDPASDNQEDSA